MGEAFITRRGGGTVGLKSISVMTPPTKTTYVPGETFDPTGMVVMADLGGVTIEASGYTVTPTTMALSTTEVTITYEFAGVTQSCTQAIAIKTLSSIAVTTPPTKTAYTYGEAFNPAGMAVTATYSDGSTAVVSGWTYSPTEALTHSDTTVTVSYSAGGTTKTATTTITIAKVLTSIAITTAPTTTQYIAGQTFSSAGMVVEATYSDGSTATVTSSCSFAPTTMSSGVTSVTVSYTYVGVTKTTSQAVTVVTPSTTLNSNSWATINMVSAAGMASQYWNVGDEKTDAIDGTNYVFQIIGFDHDDLDSADLRYNDATYNGGTNKAGITFCMKEQYSETKYMNSSNTNTGSWQNSYMRATVMPLIKNAMSSSLRAVLRTVSKLAGTGAGSTSGVNTSADTLFLLSECEVFSTRSYSVAGEGSQYAYYVAGNSRIKTRGGTASWWWLRSPYSGYSTHFLGVGSGGTLFTYYASDAGGVAAGFCV